MIYCEKCGGIMPWGISASLHACPVAPPVDAGVEDAYRGPFWADCRLDGTYQVRSQDRAIYPCESHHRAEHLAELFNKIAAQEFSSGHSAGLREAAEIARSWYEIGPSDIPGTVAHFVKHGIAKAIESKQDRLESSGGGK